VAGILVGSRSRAIASETRSSLFQQLHSKPDVIVAGGKGQMSDSAQDDYQLEYDSVQDRIDGDWKESDLVVQSSDMALMNVASLAQSGALDLNPRF
jgi:hypothetical protein